LLAFITCQPLCLITERAVKTRLGLCPATLFAFLFCPSLGLAPLTFALSYGPLFRGPALCFTSLRFPALCFPLLRLPPFGFASLRFTSFRFPALCLAPLGCQPLLLSLLRTRLCHRIGPGLYGRRLHHQQLRLNDRWPHRLAWQRWRRLPIRQQRSDYTAMQQKRKQRWQQITASAADRRTNQPIRSHRVNQTPAVP
jgi:hypothetical protein